MPDNKFTGELVLEQETGITSAATGENLFMQVDNAGDALAVKLAATNQYVIGVSFTGTDGAGEIPIVTRGKFVVKLNGTPTLARGAALATFTGGLAVSAGATDRIVGFVEVPTFGTETETMIRINAPGDATP